MRSVELFAGAGGLALGAEQAGFQTTLLAEWDRWACDSLRRNQALHGVFRDARIHEGDVRGVGWASVGPVDVVTGGPPCQPFSMGGRSRAHSDPRDMFPATAEVIRQLQPSAFIIENVRGLTRSTFANYFQYIQLRLELPEITAREGENWDDHLRRLQSERTSSTHALRYNVVAQVLNAADYGVPQQRHRVFFVGFRNDLTAEFQFPAPTHSLQALLHDQWVSGAYWDRIGVAQPKRVPDAISRRLPKIREQERAKMGKAWMTVTQSLEGLPAPRLAGTPGILDHVLQPGAKAYPGHTGSPVDMPAKALKAGDHGVPGGENMLRHRNGAVRYFSIRESARMQTFPDDYEFHGSWSEVMRQLGNAVPVRLGATVAAAVFSHLLVAKVRDTENVMPTVSMR